MRLFKGLSTHLVEIPDICDLKKRSGAWMVFIAPWIKRCQYLVTLNSAGRQAFHLFDALLVYQACANEKLHELFTAVTRSTRREDKNASFQFSITCRFRYCLETTSRQHCLEKPVLIPTKKWKQLPFYFVLAATNRKFILCRASFWKNIKKDVIPF